MKSFLTNILAIVGLLVLMAIAAGHADWIKHRVFNLRDEQPTPVECTVYIQITPTEQHRYHGLVTRY